MGDVRNVFTGAHGSTDVVTISFLGSDGPLATLAKLSSVRWWVFTAALWHWNAKPWRA